LPGLLSAAAQCGPEAVPRNAVGAAFQHACDERKAGHYVQAVQGFAQAARQAHSVGDPHWEAKSLVYMGGVQELLFEYRAALETTEAAAALANRSKEKELAAGAEINISSIYAQLGNFALARQKLTKAIGELSGSSRTDMLANAYLGLSYQEIRFGELQAGIAASDLSIQAAQQAKPSHRPKTQELEATAWDLRGTALLLAGKTSEADKSLATEVALYKASGRSLPAITLEHLAELKWKEGQGKAALDYITQAFANADASFKTTPQYYPLGVKAGILRDLGRTDEALNTYRQAIHSAKLWRRAALPGDTTNIETERQLHDTYQSFAELAAEQSLLRHEEGLSREAFEALAQNRAATLREQLALELGRNQELPPEYLAKLGELQAVQAQVTLEDDKRSQARLADLESQVAEIETKIGLRAEKKSPATENIRARNSLRDIQTALSSKETLLSFCLGERQSFLWAVTSDSMNLYRLPSESEIGQRAMHLRDSLEHHQDFARPASSLSKDLFSQLDTKVWAKPNWLITGDGALLDRVPFTVLPDKDGVSAKPIVQEHSVRLLPSELLLLARSADDTQPRFLGVADPLYNLADSRRRQAVLVNATSSRGSSALGRLPGSQREIRASVKYSGMTKSDLLIGADANLSAFTAALAQHPAIIHFAVHVVSPPGHPEQAALALSLSKNNIPELLTREKIASLRVPGSLVVLSGCSSGQGQATPSAGLIGLSRAWLLAGAEAVIVSNWPTPDDSGQFFTFFYSTLNKIHEGALAQRAASALQQAQLEMQRQGGYGSSAAFWAAYSIVSKE
jgi:CHAT domain-containing protein